MGNRGKGTKGKTNKKGKRGKGKSRAGGASKWGDEDAARADEDQPRKKKPRLTQETQDRTRRVKIFEANRAKDRDQRHRLSQPNEDPAKPQATIPRSQRRKRSRSKRPAPSRPDNRDALYYSSDEGRRQAKVGGGEEEEDVGVDAEEASGGFDAGLASYKKLLSALEGGSSSVFAAGGGDKDLAAAVVARRLQREGRDEGDNSNDSDSGSSDAEDEDEDGEDDDEDDEGDADYDEDAEEQGDDNQQGTTKNASREGPKAMDEESDGPDSTTSETHGSSSGTEDGFDATDADTVAAVEDFGTDKDDDLLLARTGKNAHVKTSDGRGRDDFSRHFVSTPVFPPDQAAGLLSPSGRPSFKPLSGAAQGKWKAMGLSASASRGADVPPGLSAGASLSQELGVLPSLADGWDACNDGPASKLQSLILPPLTGYRDMLYCGWRDEDADTIRRSYALHALNHALTSQRRVVRHTARLRKAAEETRVAAALARASAGTGGATAEQEKKVPGNGNGHGGQGPQEGKPPLAKGGRGGDASKKALDGNASSMGKTTVHSESDDWQRDQGFTRPKVLILLPFRGLAHELVEIMIGLLGTKTVVINKDRFDEEYGPDEEDNSDEASEDGEGGGAGDARAERAKAVLERKPGDWKALFGGGRNVDDMFTLGLSLSPGGGKGKPGEGKGVGVRLYCDFYNSDIVIASPVALHRACVPGGDGGGEGSGVDSDFLSSVEICIMDRADVFLMQNWAYVPELAAVLNSRPTGERAARADFSRVRPLFLHEQGRLFRQTLVFSAYQDPNLNALVSKHLRNHDGIVKISRPTGDGHICEVALQAKQVFQRVPCDSPASQDDARFEYFVGTVLMQLLRAKQAHTAVFIPSYFDYVRARNHLMKMKASVVNVHEYARGSEVARSRARFFRGDRELLLYTGRAHFFNRYCIRGIHHLIFYSLPECPQFYPEMVNLLEEAESVAAVTCLSLFTRFERLSLERIVGEDRAGHMLDSSKNTFLFC